MTKSAVEFTIEGLSPDAVAFFRENPAKAREALEAVAKRPEREVIAFRAPPSRLRGVPGISLASATRKTDDDEARTLEWLERFVTYENLMFSVSDAAGRLDVSRKTVYNWLKKSALLGWKTAGWGTIIPAEQILGPGRVVPGINRLLDIIEDPELAWTFLSQEWPFRTEVKRPIEKLRNDEVEDVLNAAPGFGTAFT